MQTQNITLDFCRNDYKTITVKQYDKDSRNLLITCTDNGVVYKLDSSTQECNVKMNTPDNRAIYNAATINEDGKVFITFDENMVYDSGTGQLEIHIIEQSTKRTLSSMILTVIIVGSVYSDDKIIASDEFNALTDALLSIDEAYQKASEAVESAQEVTDRVEKFEEQAVRAETVREQNEQLRQENTTKAINAANAATTSSTQATSSANTAASQAIEATTRLEQLERQVEQTETVREQNEQQRKETAVRAENAASAATSAANAANNAVTKAQESANRVEQLEDQIEQAESVREQNEQKRQSNTSQAVSASNAAASAANQATSNANKAAQNANTATDRANAAAEACEGVVLGAGLIPVAEKGAAGGVATLDSDGTLTDSQMPSLIYKKSGTTLTLNDSVAGGLKIDRICGGSKQEKTSGKQLLNMSGAKGGTSGGITVTVNDDGSYSYVGTATSATINVWLLGGYTGTTATLFTLSAGNYYIKDVVLFSYNGTTVKQYAYYFELTEDTPITGVRAIGAVTGTIYNETLYPMLNKGTTALPWEPYTGGIPSPNPEYQQPIVSAGQKLAKGKNLLDCSGLVEQTVNGVTFTPIYDEHGNLSYVEANGTPTANALYNLSAINFELDTAAEYVLTDGVSTNTEYYYTQLISGETNQSPNSVSSAGKFTPENVLYMARIVIKTPVSKVRFYPMIRLASETDATYEPYTGGVKKAYDVGISKKLTGKNLLKNTAKSQTVNGVTFTVNNNKSITISGTNDNTNVSDLYIYGSANDNGNYLNIPKGSIVSFEGIQKSYVELICREKETVTYNLEQLTNLLAERDCQFYGIFLRVNDGASANTTICPMIRYADIEDDTYEPYTEQTLTLNHVLRGIPLGTDIPEMFKSNALHMDGIYWNEEEQQYYIADTIDAERGVLVQRVGTMMLDGSDDEGWVSHEDTNLGIRYQLKNTGFMNSDTSSSGVHSMNTNFTLRGSGGTYIIPNCYTLADGSLYVSLNGTETLDEFKTYLSNKPMTVDGILATPIETPLTDEEIIALHQLKTYQGVTHIFGSNDPDATMIFKYSSSEIGGVTLENSNLHAVNEVLRRQMLNEIPDVWPIERGGTGATDAATALANLGGAKVSETIKTAFYDDAAENIGQLLDAKCAHARELNAPAVCIYGGWQNIDFGVFYAQVVNNVVNGIYVKGDTAYIVRCDNGTDTATYLEVATATALANTTDAAVKHTAYVESGVDLNTVTQSGFYRLSSGHVNTPSDMGAPCDWSQMIVMHGGGDTITQIISDYSTANLYTRSGNPSDIGGSGGWTGWVKVAVQSDIDENIPYKIVIDDTAGTIDFIDR